MTPAAATVRPNGKTYRPRKPPRPVAWENEDGRHGITVLGTHDRALGDQLALDQYAYDFGQPETDRVPEPTADWTRLGYQYGELTHLHDPEHGAASLTYEWPES